MSRMALRTIVLGLCISGAALGQTDAEAPQVLPYEEGEPIPSGYELHSRPRLGLVITGGVLSGAAYGFAVMGAIDDKLEHQGGFLLIPVLGPWLTLAAGGARTTCGAQEDHCSETDRGKSFVLGLDGVIQAAGAIMITTGLLFPRQRLERTDLTVGLLPASIGEGRYGAVLVGAF